MSKVPVTVLTGYLGSGKTTLLNYILTQNHGLRICVLENEFGEVGIDDALVINAEEEIFEMNNGCICCTVRGDLIRILSKMAKKKNKFDYVLIETTGLADPAPVAQTFFVDEDIAESYYLDGIVTVIDSKHVLQHIDEEKPDGVENESVEQIAFADRIIMNKIDLLKGNELDLIKKRVYSINNFAPIIEATNAIVDLKKILNIKSFDLKKVLEAEPDFLNPDHEHMHDTSVSSVSIVTSDKVDGRKFTQWIRILLAERGVDIYRSKGIVNMRDESKPLVFQGVHMLLDMELGQMSTEGPSRLVFIGKNLNKEELTTSFKQKCF